MAMPPPTPVTKSKTEPKILCQPWHEAPFEISFHVCTAADLQRHTQDGFMLPQGTGDLVNACSTAHLVLDGKCQVGVIIGIYRTKRNATLHTPPEHHTKVCSGHHTQFQCPISHHKHGIHYTFPVSNKLYAQNSQYALHSQCSIGSAIPVYYVVHSVRHGTHLQCPA